MPRDNEKDFEREDEIENENGRQENEPDFEGLSDEDEVAYEQTEEQPSEEVSEDVAEDAEETEEVEETAEEAFEEQEEIVAVTPAQPDEAKVSTPDSLDIYAYIRGKVSKDLAGKTTNEKTISSSVATLINAEMAKYTAERATAAKTLKAAEDNYVQQFSLLQVDRDRTVDEANWAANNAQNQLEDDFYNDNKDKVRGLVSAVPFNGASWHDDSDTLRSEIEKIDAELVAIGRAVAKSGATVEGNAVKKSPAVSYDGVAPEWRDSADRLEALQTQRAELEKAVAVVDAFIGRPVDATTPEIADAQDARNNYQIAGLKIADDCKAVCAQADEDFADQLKPLEARVTAAQETYSNANGNYFAWKAMKCRAKEISKELVSDLNNIALARTKAATANLRRSVRPT